jgi:hypothetical protein
MFQNQFVIDKNFKCIVYDPMDVSQLQSMVYGRMDLCMNDATLLASLGNMPVQNTIGDTGIGSADFSGGDFGYSNTNFNSFSGGFEKPFF